MTEQTLRQLETLIQCDGKCKKEQCICYGENSCKYEAILNKICTILYNKFEGNNK